MHLLELISKDEYRIKFEEEYIRGDAVMTVDSIIVKFRAERFEHDFFCCSGKDCNNHKQSWRCDKDKFDNTRAQRMLWIRMFISGKIQSDIYEGKDPKDRNYKRYYIYTEVDSYAIVLRKSSTHYIFATAFCPEQDWINNIKRHNRKVQL